MYDLDILYYIVSTSYFYNYNTHPLVGECKS